VTISQTDEKMDVPVDEFDGKVIYGEKRKQEGLNRFILNLICMIELFVVPVSKEHVDSLASTVEELVELEKRVQTSFFALRNCRNIIASS
jgi:ATP-dependent RNA helicase DDX1